MAAQALPVATTTQNFLYRTARRANRGPNASAPKKLDLATFGPSAASLEQDAATGQWVVPKVPTQVQGGVRVCQKKDVKGLSLSNHVLAHTGPQERKLKGVKQTLYVHHLADDTSLSNWNKNAVAGLYTLPDTVNDNLLSKVPQGTPTDVGIVSHLAATSFQQVSNFLTVSALSKTTTLLAIAPSFPSIISPTPTFPKLGTTSLFRVS